MNLTLQCRETPKPHPEGVHSAVCVDVIDLGLVQTEFQGQKRIVQKIRIVFESEAVGEDGNRCTISKAFNASLNPKARLAEFLGKWRGRPILPGETIDLTKLMGACCTLVVSHQQNLVGRTYGSIDAISKPTKKIAPSGQYDPAQMRQRIAEARAREAATPSSGRAGLYPSPSVALAKEGAPADVGRAGLAQPAVPSAPQPSPAPAPSQQSPSQNFDPEVGF